MSTSSRSDEKSFDEEKASAIVSPAEETEIVKLDDGVNRSTGPFAKCWKVVQWADSFGVEARGIERVPPTERHHTKIHDIASMWAGANTQISTIALGTLGASVFRLSLKDAFLTILFFNLFSTLPVALFSTFGKATGMRQLVISRYSFGSVGVYFPTLLNLVACLGWSTVNNIIGTEALRAVAPDSANQIPIFGGVLVLALGTMIIALFGYRHVHYFEKYASLPIAVVFFIMLGQAVGQVTVDNSAPTNIASVLSFGSAIAGFGLGWSSLAADYTVNMPEDASSIKIFLYAYLGNNIPLILIQTLGASLMFTFEKKTTWGLAYEAHGTGGLFAAVLSPMRGFGQFCLVVLALSVIANNVLNIYSVALTFQALGKSAQAIPRCFIVLVATAISIGLSIAGAEHFEVWLETLLVILSYWLAIYVVVLSEEHFIFRRTWSAYNLDAYNTRELLPVGYAAMGASAFGIMGAVMGMAQRWYVGPIGRTFGGFGGDLGFELSGLFAAVTYPGLRYLELKYVGR